jgi:hypothetical protein
MASVPDVEDASIREALATAEAALDDGDYATSVEHTVTAYTRLIDLRPDMIIGPRFAHGSGGTLGVAPRPWPSDHGVRFSMDDRGRPALTFAKQRFTLSEAATYFEYTLDMALRAQRHPPA